MVIGRLELAAVKAGDWAGIEANVRKTVEAVAAFRAAK